MRKDCGLTLIELLITVTIAAILLGVGVPSISDFVRDNRRAATVNSLITDIQRARSAAASHGARALLCHSTNGTSCSGLGTPDWSDGWLLFLDDNFNGTLDATDGNGEPDSGEPVLSRSAPRDGVTMPSTVNRLTFNAGYRSVSGFGGTIAVCVPGPNNDRWVIVGPTGRPRIADSGSPGC